MRKKVLLCGILAASLLMGAACSGEQTEADTGKKSSKAQEQSVEDDDRAAKKDSDTSKNNGNNAKEDNSTDKGNNTTDDNNSGTGDGNSDGGETGKVNAKKKVYYRTYEIVVTDEEEMWHSDDYLNLDFHPDDNYVQFDLCNVSGFYGLSYFTTACPPTTGYYRVNQYDGGGGMGSSEPVYIDYRDDIIYVYFCDAEGEKAESGMKFKLVNDSRTVTK